MCGTFTSILGQALAIGVIDMAITPNLGMSTFRILFDFVAKGVATFYVYRYSCKKSTNSSSRPFDNLSLMTVLVGGIIGAGVMALSSLFLPNNMFGGMNFLEYIVEAVILNFVYGMSATVVADLSG